MLKDLPSKFPHPIHLKASPVDLETQDYQVVSAHTSQAASSYQTPKSFKLSRKQAQRAVEIQRAEQAWSQALGKVVEDFRIIRKAKGISLPQLHHLTHIPLYQLRNLEQGHWDKLPEEIYVRGFIRCLGDALGLNGDKIANALPTSNPYPCIIPSWYQAPDHSSYLQSIHLYLGYATLIAGAVGGVSWLVGQPHASPPISDLDIMGTMGTNITVLDQTHHIYNAGLGSDGVQYPSSKTNQASVSVPEQIGPEF